jgi:hypothetical protein
VKLIGGFAFVAVITLLVGFVGWIGTARLGCNGRQLVEEIAAASREQAQGIEQINQGVSEMDQVTRQNAAKAEESTSASEARNAQAEPMKSQVTELLALVGGKSVVDDAPPRDGRLRNAIRGWCQALSRVGLPVARTG